MDESDLKALRLSATRAQKSGDLQAAAKQYAQYLAYAPQDSNIWSNLGVLHRVSGRHDMALRAQKKAAALDPDAVGIRNNLANIYSDLGFYDESLVLRYAALKTNPDDRNNLAMVGRCLRCQGKYAAAIRHLAAACKQFPDDAELRIQLAFAQLGAGEYTSAFENYRARWQAGELTARKLPLPEWKGEDIRGRTILVLPEQGFGDAILFSRFLPVLKDAGATVHLLIERPLRRLLHEIDGVDKLVQTYRKGDEADVWVNMMDLALLYFQTETQVPQPISVNIPKDSVARAEQIVSAHQDVFRVGVVWTGSPTYKGNAFRSFQHTDFLPLTEIENVQLFSLYKGVQLEAFRADGADAFIIDAAGDDRDFADCAATMTQMDLIITSDTATAHLAGSMGIPTWVVLHWDPFWVWRHEGDRTDWYPSIRLFRQPAPRDWAGVMSQVRAALVEQVEGQK